MANEEHLEILRQGVEVWNEWRIERRKQGLSFVDLRNASLSGANLSEADLFNVNLGWADLHGANLSHANLGWASLREAILRDADLSGAKLFEADLSGVDLREANLIGTNLGRANLSGANLSGANLSGARLSGADLSVAELTNSLLKKANLYDVDLSNASCQKANMMEANLNYARLSYTKLNGANLTGVRLWESQRAYWSIEGVICEYAYLEVNDKVSYFAQGEFERLYTDKIKIVLSYKDGISPLEAATIPALIQHLENSCPSCTLRLKSIEDAPGGADVTFTIEETVETNLEKMNQLMAQIEKQGAEFIKLQRKALRDEKKRLVLEGQIKLLNSYVKEIIMQPSQIHGDYIQGDKQMGDNYTVGQGIVGKNVQADNNTFNQIGGQIENSIDLKELAAELLKLREAMKEEAEEPGQFTALAEVAKAEEAAKEKDSSKVAVSLKAAGKWALDVATKIGTTVAAKAIETSIGM